MAALGLLVCAAASADRFVLLQDGSRVWAGDQVWTSPMQDWYVDGGVLIGKAARHRQAALMPCKLTGEGDWVAEARIDMLGQTDRPAEARGGFRFGTHGEVDRWENRAMYPQGGLEVGVRADGRLFIGEQTSRETIALDQPVTLRVRYDRQSNALTASATRGQDAVTLRQDVPSPDDLRGGAHLFIHTPKWRPPADKPDHLRYAFRGVKLDGTGLVVHDDRRFGPILWSQYTLSDGVLKLSAQMPPLGIEDEQTVGLEVNRGGRWERIANEPIDPDARIAVFRVADWPDEQDVDYRVVYRWQGDDHTWAGTIRRDPKDQGTFDLAVFSCDYGYAFPHPRLVEAVKQRDPDMLFFAGDQIYERFGGFGITRQPIDAATLDYLRKWYQFGWTWRELMRDRPTVTITDDHDVFQGNLYGMGGAPTPKGKTFDWGGYLMPPRWVNMAQRTQTAHLPDPADPAPTPSGIDVYFTQLRYAGGRFAILEDRKFKSGRGRVREQLAIPAGQTLPTSRFDVPGAQLLGDRQEAFLKAWAEDAKTGRFNVVMTQTIFAQVYTHGGPEMKRSRRDFDTNAWPQTPRNRALRLIKPSGAVVVCGDQHFGMLARTGIDTAEDGPVTLMAPGTANGWPRASWPGVEESSPMNVDGAQPLGQRRDPFGHPVDVIAVANPVPRGHTRTYADPEAKARGKASGFGLVRFHKPENKATFELLRYPAALGQPADPFPGFPVTLELDDPP